MVSIVRSSRIRMPLLALSLVTLVCQFAIAADSVPQGKLAVLALDPAKTTIRYSLEGWPHHTQGIFSLKHGVIRIDPQNGKMDGLITVDAASGNSGHSLRDEKMKSSILEVNRFPEISFAPQQVVSHGNPQAEFPVTVRGLMSLHGTQHPLTVDASIRRVANEVTIHCSFVIPYVDWGLKDPSILMFRVSKRVHVDMTTTAHLTWVLSTWTPAAPRAPAPITER